MLNGTKFLFFTVTLQSREIVEIDNLTFGGSNEMRKKLYCH